MVTVAMLEEELKLQKSRVADRDQVIRGLTHKVFALESDLQAAAAELADVKEKYHTKPAVRHGGTNTGSDWVLLQESVELLCEMEAYYRMPIWVDYSEWFAMALAQRWHMDSTNIVLANLRFTIQTMPGVVLTSLNFSGTSSGVGEDSDRRSFNPISFSPVLVNDTRFSSSPAGSSHQPSGVFGAGVNSTPSRYGGISTHRFEGDAMNSPASQQRNPGHRFQTTLLAAGGRSTVGPASSSTGGAVITVAMKQSPIAESLQHMSVVTSTLQTFLAAHVSQLRTNYNEIVQRHLQHCDTRLRIEIHCNSLFKEEAYQRHAIQLAFTEQSYEQTRILIHCKENEVLARQLKQVVQDHNRILDFGMNETVAAHLARSELLHAVQVGTEKIANAERTVISERESCFRVSLYLVESADFIAIDVQMQAHHDYAMASAMRDFCLDTLLSASVTLRHVDEPSERQTISDLEVGSFLLMTKMHHQWTSEQKRYLAERHERERKQFVAHAIGSIREVVHPLLRDCASSFWHFLRSEILVTLEYMQDTTNRRSVRRTKQHQQVINEASNEMLLLERESSRDFLRLVVSHNNEKRTLERSEQKGAEQAFVFRHAGFAVVECLSDVKRTSLEFLASLLTDYKKIFDDSVFQLHRAQVSFYNQARRVSVLADQESSGRRFIEVWEAEHCYERILIPMHAANISRHIRLENESIISTIETDTIAIVKQAKSREHRLVHEFATISFIPAHQHISDALLQLHADLCWSLASYLWNDVSLSEKRWRHKATSDAHRQIAAASSSVAQTLESTYDESLTSFSNMKSDLQRGYEQRIAIIHSDENRRLGNFFSTSVIQFLSQRQELLADHSSACLAARSELLQARSETATREVLDVFVIRRVANMQHQEAVYCGNLMRESWILARRLSDECSHIAFQYAALKQHHDELLNSRSRHLIQQRTESDELQHTVVQYRSYIHILDEQKIVQELQSLRFRELLETEAAAFIAIAIASAGHIKMKLFRAQQRESSPRSGVIKSVAEAFFDGSLSPPSRAAAYSEANTFSSSTSVPPPFPTFQQPATRTTSSGPLLVPDTSSRWTRGAANAIMAPRFDSSPSRSATSTSPLNAHTPTFTGRTQPQQQHTADSDETSREDDERGLRAASASLSGTEIQRRLRELFTPSPATGERRQQGSTSQQQQSASPSRLLSTEFSEKGRYSL